MNSHTEAFSPSTLDDREAGPSNQKRRKSIQSLLECEILKITDSVYEIHKPSRAKSWMDIVFFHDLYLPKSPHAHLSTWTSQGDDSLLWPKKWLADDYPDTRILCISYDASIQKDDKNGRMDMYLVVETLLQMLIIAGVGQHNPMLLIGHGLGGLVIKQLCLDSFSCGNRNGDQQAKDFFENIEGIFYYGTPHQGGSFSYPIAEELNLDAGDLVKCVKLLNTNLARCNHEFENLRKNHGSKWKFGSLGETLPTKLGDGVSVIVVPEASCRGGQNFMMVKEDHNTICKPRDKESTNYLHLTKLINEISTSTVLKKVCKPPTPDDFQILPQKFVMPSKCLEDIKEKFKKRSCLALWGMGGIGKTTISKVVFNDLHHDFEFTLFKENVKLLQRKGKELEGILLADVHHNGRKPGGLALKDLKAKAILVVLDDVEDNGHTVFINSLQQICSSKSRFILTSRDKQILTQLDDVSIVAVEVLDPQNSEKLFQSYAFSEDKVDMQQSQQIFQNKIVRRCYGLPLTLEVVGRYLRDCSTQEVWEQTYKQLKEIDNGSALIGLDQVWSKLQISYDNLDQQTQQIFIEAATFFSQASSLGYEYISLHEAKAAWRRIYANSDLSWNHLVRRALVYDVGDDSQIMMHEHFRTLADNIQKDMHKNPDLGIILVQSRENKTLSTQQIIQALSESACEVHTLWSSEYYSIFGLPPIQLLLEDAYVFRYLHDMKKLRYLCMANVTKDLTIEKLPKNVVIFCGNFEGKNIPEDFFALSTSLVKASMKTRDIKCLPELFRGLKHLQFLKLQAEKLKHLPTIFHNLKKFSLSANSLMKLPPVFPGRTSLQSLTLNCPHLESLPDSIGHLEKLEEFWIKSKVLVKFPIEFRGRTTLQSQSLFVRATSASGYEGNVNAGIRTESSSSFGATYAQVVSDVPIFIFSITDSSQLKSRFSQCPLIFEIHAQVHF